jgi:hypothetical protein
MATALIEVLEVIQQLAAFTAGRVAGDCDHVLGRLLKGRHLIEDSLAYLNDRRGYWKVCADIVGCDVRHGK